MAPENEIVVEARPTLAERVTSRAAELELAGWTRAAADGLAKNQLGYYEIAHTSAATKK